MGYEAHPEEYIKAEDGGYDRKPEYRAEQEARLQAESEEERMEREKAEAHKRAHRRTSAMDMGEMLSAVNKARQIADAFVQTGL